MSDTEGNKQVVNRLMEAFSAGDVDALDDLLAADYVQHNPLVGTGREAVKDYLRPLGPVDLEVHRMIAEGDLVSTHVHYKSLNIAVVDFFRVKDGKIVEHWDAIQEVVTDTVSGNDMFSQLTD